MKGATREMMKTPREQFLAALEGMGINPFQELKMILDDPDAPVEVRTQILLKMVDKIVPNAPKEKPVGADADAAGRKRVEIIVKEYDLSGVESGKSVPAVRAPVELVENVEENHE